MMKFLWISLVLMETVWARPIILPKSPEPALNDEGQSAELLRRENRMYDWKDVRDLQTALLDPDDWTDVRDLQTALLDPESPMYPPSHTSLLESPINPTSQTPSLERAHSDSSRPHLTEYASSSHQTTPSDTIGTLSTEYASSSLQTTQRDSNTLGTVYGGIAGPSGENLGRTAEPAMNPASQGTSLPDGVTQYKIATPYGMFQFSMSSLISSMQQALMTPVTTTSGATTPVTMLPGMATPGEEMMTPRTMPQDLTQSQQPQQGSGYQEMAGTEPSQPGYEFQSDDEDDYYN